MAASSTGYTLTAVTGISDVSLGNFRQKVYDLNPTASSYFTTGYLITPATVGLTHIYNVLCGTQNPAGGTPITGIVLPFWDHANTALQFFQSTTGAPAAFVEVASATDLSGYTFRLIFYGY